jgi:hypothetical protein
VDVAISRRHFAVAIVVILGWAAAAHAEDAAPPPPPPAGSRPLADTPFQLAPPQEHLFGIFFNAPGHERLSQCDLGQSREGETL